MRLSVSATGDTIAVASASSNTQPIIVIFDRLGENWIETTTISPFEQTAIAQNWDHESMNIQLSNNGDRIAFAAQPSVKSVNKFDDRGNQVLIYDRSTVTWTRTASLSIPVEYSRLPSLSTSDSIDKVLVLSALRGSLYLHEFSQSNNQWTESSSQLLESVYASVDTQIVSSMDASLVSIAGWEQDRAARRSPVAWKFERRAAGWISTDSIRLPPTKDESARLRLASDAQLQSVAIGWQAHADANIAFYETYDGRWQHQFSVPESFELNRSIPLAQSVVISADNSTALIGTSDNEKGGLVSSFR